LSFLSQNVDPYQSIKWGSSSYLAPEIILGQKCTTKCDIWSSGVILYFMVSGHLPFEAKDHQHLYIHIINNEPIYSFQSQALIGVLKVLLAKNPVNRIPFWKINDMKWFSD
jgi:serine/threonine protein kinase